MKQLRKSEKGQALVLIVFAIVGMLALVGLAMDGGQSFSDRRKVQNAADAAVLAEVLTYQKENHSTTNLITKAQAAAAVNGYKNDADTNVQVDAPVATNPGECGKDADGVDVQGMKFTVTITSTVKTWFAPVVGVKEVNNTVTATSKACNWRSAPLREGHAIEAFDPGPNSPSFNAGNSPWTVKGGNVFSNSDAAVTVDRMSFPDGHCIAAAGTAAGFSSCSPVLEHQASQKLEYPGDIAEFMPPNPCDGIVNADGSSDVGIPFPYSSIPSGKGGTLTISNGVYCVNDFDGLQDVYVILDNATLYITDTVFDLKYNGGKGGVMGKATTASGPYQNYFLISTILDRAAADRCDQNFDIRGNGTMDITGTILLPSGCWDARGNNNPVINGQFLGYRVTGNSNHPKTVNYSAANTARYQAPPWIELIK